MFLQPIILCGGYGSRLWPLSRRNMPKQFLKIFNGKSLFQMSLERISKIKDIRSPIIVTSKLYEHIIKDELEQLSIKAQIILEPQMKNTTASIYLSAKYSEPNDVLLIMPSDHIIENVNKFKEIIDLARENVFKNWIVFGIPPNYPSTSYGYIKTNHIVTDINADQDKINDVLKFIEKPDIKLAEEIYKTKKFLWNSGIFMSSRNIILESINKWNQLISKRCDEVFENATFDSINMIVNFNYELFNKIPSQSIDYSVIEKIKNIKCIRLDVGWNDVGSWDNALRFLKNTENTIQLEGRNKIYKADHKIIATVGVDNLIIIDTKDAILITKKNRSEDLKIIFDMMLENKIDFMNNNTFDKRPWGSFEVLLDSPFLKVKKLNIDCNKRISYQYHEHRSEHWVVIKGKASVKLNSKIFELNEGESIDIKKRDNHYVGNFTDEDLILIEVQMGDYFGEDDINRIDDPYKRVIQNVNKK